MAHVREVSRKTGRAYEVRWRDGARERQRTFSARREAERFALRIENELQDGQSTEPLVRRGKTFRQVAESMLTAAAPDLRPKSLGGYELALRLHIYPTLGDRRIAAISSLDVERWLGEMRTKVSPKTGRPLAVASVRGAMIALGRVFSYAEKHRLIAVNPTPAVDMPRKASVEHVFLTSGQVETIATALEPSAPYNLTVRFAAYTGLRAGELAALRIRDVNFLRRHVEVRRTVQRVKGGWRYGEPKTARSRRDVPVRRVLLEELARYLETHPYRTDRDALLWPGRVQGGYGSGKSALDFDRPFDVASCYRYYFRPAAAAAGVPEATWHSLRHSYASIMAAAGVDIFKVSRYMGHSNVAVTDGVYAHMFRDAADVDMDKLDAFVTASRPRA